MALWFPMNACIAHISSSGNAYISLIEVMPENLNRQQNKRTLEDYVFQKVLDSSHVLCYYMTTGKYPAGDKRSGTIFQ